MGYVLWVRERGSSAAELVAAAEARAADPVREARKGRLVARLTALEPQLHVFPTDEGALAEALPELSAGAVAHLARSVDLDGWPGVQINLGDDWVTVEIATWPQMAAPEMVERITRVIEAVCDETRWVCVDAERDIAHDEPRTAVEVATGTAVRWGDAVRESARTGSR
jgi:hypothetical protein